MKTLRDERGNRGWASVERKYGDYRVVEGVVCLSQSDDGTEFCVDTGRTTVSVGMEGDHVTLLLPPEKKEPRVELLARLCKAENDLMDMDMCVKDADARADRCKEVLGEIGCCRYPMLTQKDVIALLRKKAQEALDEDAER